MADPKAAQTSLPRSEPEVPKDVLDRAVDAKLREVLPMLTDEITRQVSAAITAAGGVGAGVDQTGLISQLVNQLAEVNRRGDGRPYVSPQDQAKREAARGKLIECLDDLAEQVAAGKAELPTYTLTGQIQDSDLGLIDAQLWENRKIINQRIASLRIPNEAMQPENDTAKAVYALFLESIGVASIGGAYHQGALRDRKGQLWMMKQRGAAPVGGADNSSPAGLSENPTLATKEAAGAGLTLLGQKSEGSIERVAILGTVQERAKMQRL